MPLSESLEPAAEGHSLRTVAAVAPSAAIIRKNVSVVSLAYTIGALAGFVAQAQMARRLGGPTFGIYVAALSLVTILAVLDELGGSGYLVREATRDPARLGSLLGDVLLLKVLVNVIVVALSVGSATLLGFGRTGIVVAALLAVMLGANAMSRSLRAGLQAIERLGTSSAISVGNSLVSAAGIMWILAAGGGVVAAMAFSAGVSVVVVPVSWLALRRLVHFRLRAKWGSALRAMRSSLPFAAVAVLTFATTYADSLVVRRFLGERPTGLYGAAYRIVVVLQFVPSIYLDSVYRTLSYAAHTQRDRFGALVERSAAGLCMLALPLAAGGLVLGGRVLDFVFGPQYGSAAEAFRVLLWSLPFAFPTWILLTAVVVGERPSIAGWLLAIAFVLNVGANVALVPRYGIIAAAWTTVATEAFLVAGASIVLARDGVARAWPSRVAPAVLAAGLMVPSILAARHLPLAVPVLLGALVYFGTLLVLRVPRSLGLVRSRASSEGSVGRA